TREAYYPGEGTGPEGFKERVGGYRGVMDEFDLRIERQIGEGDWVETHWSLRGNHGGELEGTAPTGKSVYVDGQLLSHIVDGKFVEEWVHWNTLGLLRQIGAVPPPKGEPRILRHSKIAVTMEIYTEVPDQAACEALRRLGQHFDS